MAAEVSTSETNSDEKITEEEEGGEEYIGNIIMNAEEQKQTLLEELKEVIGKKSSIPRTVAVIGTPGAGKSSFINTMITSITGKYRQWTRTGDHGGTGDTITRRVIRIPREEYMSFADTSLQEYNFPDFLDIAGFQNTNDEITRELLKLLFFGRIPYDVPLDDIAKDIRQHGPWFTYWKYPKTQECKKVDRVVFIASATNPHLSNLTNPPVQLMKAVLDVLRRKREIPIFGVLTKKDRIKQKIGKVEEYENTFKTMLGLSQLNYLQCTNYCDENINEIRERTMTYYPELDIPVLKFLIQVLDPIFQCTDFHRSTGFSKKKLIYWLYKMVANMRGISYIYLLFMFVVIPLIAVILKLVLF